jgi:4-amino-4-deoxy-L-arabinose transferase-like glycosyltransferase
LNGTESPPQGTEETGLASMREPGTKKALEAAGKVLPLVLVAGLMVTAFLLLRHYFYLHNEYTTDSYYYMVLARSMKSGLGYTVRGAAYTLYPPGYPFLIMLASLVIGDMAVAAGYVSILGAVFAILFTYLIGRELFGEVAGLLAAAVLTFQPAFLKWACLPMAEGLFTLGFTAAVYLWLTGCTRGSRGRRLAGAAVGGFALFTRVQGLLLFPLLGLILLLYLKDAEISLWELPVEIALVAVPFGIFLLRNLVQTGHLTKYSDVYNKHKSPLTVGVLGTRLKTYGWSATLDKVVMGLAYSSDGSPCSSCSTSSGTGLTSGTWCRRYPPSPCSRATSSSRRENSRTRR